MRRYITSWKREGKHTKHAVAARLAVAQAALTGDDEHLIPDAGYAFGDTMLIDTAPLLSALRR